MMGSFYSRLRHWSSHRTLALVFLGFSACHAGPTSPRGPAPSTRSDVRKAEEAERQRDHHRARALYQHAVTEAPNDASRAYATREMASALVFWGEYRNAVQLLEESLQSDTTQVQVWHDLGVLHSHLNNDEAAQRALTRAVQLAPKEPRSRIALAALLVRRQQYRAAQAQYKALLDLSIPLKLESAVRKALRLLDEEITQGIKSARRP